MPEDSFLEAVAAVDSAAFTIDSFALRNLVFNRPVETEVLSSLSLMEGRFVQRVRCLSEREEESIVTLRLRNEEAATARYKGFAMTTEWRLEGLTGEPLDGTSRRAPEVGLGPEQVVASQLQHLRDSDIERVYNFASPRNKKAVGNLANFGEIVASPPYGMVRNRLPRSLPPSSRSMARDLDALLGRGPED